MKTVVYGMLFLGLTLMAGAIILNSESTARSGPITADEIENTEDGAVR